MKETRTDKTGVARWKKGGAFLLLLCLGIFVLNLTVNADTEKQKAVEIHSAIILATMEDVPPEPPAFLNPYLKGFKKVFGYNSYYLVGESRNSIHLKEEVWVIPSKKLFLHVRANIAEKDSYVVDLELYCGDKRVLTTTANLRAGSPLVVRGPEWGKGQFILILTI